HISVLVVLSVPHDLLRERVLLERLRRVRAQDPARQVTEDGARRVLDRHGHVAPSLGGEVDLHPIALARHARLPGELEDLLPLDPELLRARPLRERGPQEEKQGRHFNRLLARRSERKPDRTASSGASVGISWSSYPKRMHTSRMPSRWRRRSAREAFLKSRGSP